MCIFLSTCQVPRSQVSREGGSREGKNVKGNMDNGVRVVRGWDEGVSWHHGTGIISQAPGTIWLAQLKKGGQTDRVVGMSVMCLSCVKPRQGRLEEGSDWCFVLNVTSGVGSDYILWDNEGMFQGN